MEGFCEIPFFRGAGARFSVKICEIVFFLHYRPHFSIKFHNLWFVTCFWVDNEKIEGFCEIPFFRGEGPDFGENFRQKFLKLVFSL